MPGFDGRGPWGRRAGRGMGPCGRGFGWRYSEPVTLSKEEQKRVLEAELKELETEKEAIQRKLKELK